MPERIQLSRRKGWRKPEGAVVVARPSKWGNPYVVEQFGDEWACGYRMPDGTIAWAGAEATREEAREVIVKAFAGMLTEHPWDLSELRGKDLACWCPPVLACHADVLIELANQERDR